jgi:hypothetical protein
MASVMNRYNHSGVAASDVSWSQAALQSLTEFDGMDVISLSRGIPSRLLRCYLVTNIVAAKNAIQSVYRL